MEKRIEKNSMAKLTRHCLYKSLFIFLIISLPQITFANQNNSYAEEEDFIVEYYAIPAPDEILYYIHENEIQYTPSLLTDINNQAKYNTTTERLLSFGFYLADMAYAVSFEQSGTAFRYFDLIDDMGKNMNLFPPEVEDITLRLMNNMNRMDSLNIIYDELYLTVIGNLHDTDRFSEYAIISAGGFVEAMYLALHSDGAKHDEKSFKARVWDQKLIINQLNTMFERYLSGPEKERLIKEIEPLTKAFNKIENSEKEFRGKEREDGAIVIGSNSPDKEKNLPSLEEIKKEIDSLRNRWVKD
ncbi:hypothetical protein QA597_09435 [Marinilabiliaceae bacterium ANBcel2]|nr:hypothetical protein [Marinilabiliaceae bacterium ANBcel2]